DLTTWHLINTVYQPSRVSELRNMADFYGDPAHHRRLMKVVQDRLGHALVGRAEAAKIAVADGGHTDIDLALVEAGLHNGLDAEQAARALEADVERITLCALDTVRLAGLKPGQLGALYFTGGSTGLTLLTDALQAAFPGARAVRGDRLASVATGLGLYARKLFTS
ncbi:MAG: heat-shock protein, partial [Herbaspirillum sp.]|nr:heat-shock protein [Herbaspirillum sp.]